MVETSLINVVLLKTPFHVIVISPAKKVMSVFRFCLSARITLKKNTGWQFIFMRFFFPQKYASILFFKIHVLN